MYERGGSYNLRYFENNPHYHFLDYTWYDFFDEFIAPTSKNFINFNCAVNTINYSDSEKPVSVTCRDGRSFRGDHVIVAVPVTVLQSPSQIDFVPSLPKDKLDALEEVRMPPGSKLFLKFSNRFYDEAFQLIEESATENERFFYDAAWGRSSAVNILGVIVIGTEISRRYAGQSKEVVTTFVLQDLDRIYDGKASASFVESFYQDWSVEPFIKGSYSFYGRRFRGTIRTLIRPHDRLFFAGEHLPAEEWDFGFVHGAALSGRAAAASVLAAISSPDTCTRRWLFCLGK